VTAPLALLQLANPESGVPLPPRWGWYVVLYFFVGGLTAGCYAIAAALDLAGDPRDRGTVRLGYALALPGLLICTVLLIIDLGRPERFWHMLVKSKHVPAPIFKYWSPISLGSWILAVFGLFAFVAFLDAMLDSGRLRWQPAIRARDALRRLPHGLRAVWLVLGILFACGLGGYTGVLMVGTTRPVWHGAVPLGGLFLASAASTSYALLLLLLLRAGPATQRSTLAKLADADGWALLVELLLVALTLVTLGAVARPVVSGGYGVLFWIGVVLAGVVVPLVLHLRHGAPGALLGERGRAVLVLVGGLILRFVFVMAPQWPRVRPWHL
jgi:formate-dependent nitrite reductase membrane component NrfD